MYFFSTNVENHIVKEHFGSILDFLIDYLEHKNLKAAVNLSFVKNRERVEKQMLKK